MGETELRVGEMPHLFDVFDLPKIKAVRGTTAIHRRLAFGEVLRLIPSCKLIETSKKKVLKFEVRRGSYLLLFPTGYIEVYAPEEGGIREVLLAFRDKLCEVKLL